MSYGKTFARTCFVFWAIVLNLLLLSVLVGSLAKSAGAAEIGSSALVTEYHSAPGHGPSLSAVCDADGIKIGSHPWDASRRNFQVWHDGALLVNVTTGQPQYWIFEQSDYTLKYAGNKYEVKGEKCDSAPTTTTASTTTTSEPPTTTIASPTTTSSSAPPTETFGPPTSQPPSDEFVPLSDPVPELPNTGVDVVTLIFLASILVIVGSAVLSINRQRKKENVS